MMIIEDVKQKKVIKIDVVVEKITRKTIYDFSVNFCLI